MSNKNISVDFTNQNYLLSSLNLDSFKEMIQDSFHQIYASKRRQASFYQYAFFSLSVIFLIMAMIVYFKTTNWNCHVYLGQCEFLRLFIGLLCLALSLGTLALGFTIRPEKEAIHALVENMKKNLNELYQAYQQQSLSVHHVHPISFHEMYYQALDHIHDRQEKTFQLLDSIALSKEINWKAKEYLFNQAINELHNQLNQVVYTFKAKAI